ncbi:MAG: hypothetical protein ABFD04_03175 [Syntrophomonas sp.]
MAIGPMLNRDELMILERLNHYFKSNQMTTREKARAARLIAEHDLESQQYGSEKERQIVLFFYKTLEKLVDKL